MTNTKRNLTGKSLNKLWNVGANHALFREDGKWYHQLTKFPGALFDSNGYIVFTNETEYNESPYLQIKQDLHIPEGISKIPGYVRVTERNQFMAFSRALKETADQNQLYLFHDPDVDTPETSDLPDKGSEVKRTLTQVSRIIRDTEIARRVKVIYNYRCQICGNRLDLGNVEYYAESHHIKPLGGKHNGPDIIENIICVCPNHHVLLDYGVIALEKEELILSPDHMVSDVFIKYHNTILLRNKIREKHQ